MKLLATLALVAALVPTASAGENLRLNAKLDYTSDSQDGPLITGDNMDSGVTSGKPAYIIFYGEACYNSKRQARRTVSLYEKYKGRVEFVIVDLDHRASTAQQDLQKKYYRGYIPHVVVLDARGTALYNEAGEVEEGKISEFLDKSLR
jgi:thioredoxin-like negative regulator of GroEL